MHALTRLKETTCHASLSGRFTFGDQQAFATVVAQFENPAVQILRLDLTEVEFIDSAALGMLLLALEKAEKLDKKLVLCGATGQVKKMFGMANFHTIFTIE